jgi:hypothetical protein
LGPLFDRLFLTNAGVFCVIIVQIIGALGLLLGYNTRFSTLLALVPFFLLHERMGGILDGGDNITQIVLIYMLLLLPYRAKFSSGEFQVWLHNLGVLAIALQLVIVYFVAGLEKAYGDWWQQGVAMYYITQVQWFTLPGANELFTNPWLVTIVTYGTIIFEVMFPTAIISRIKIPWLVCGVLMHIGIAVIMGMIPFATIMSGLDLFLISDQEYVQIWQQGQLFLTSLARIPIQAYGMFNKNKNSILEERDIFQADREETLKADEEDGNCVVHEQSA